MVDSGSEASLEMGRELTGQCFVEFPESNGQAMRRVRIGPGVLWDPHERTTYTLLGA